MTDQPMTPREAVERTARLQQSAPYTTAEEREALSVLRNHAIATAPEGGDLAALALAFADGVWAADHDAEDDDVAHYWRIRLRDRAAAGVDAEDSEFARRLAALPPETSPAGWPPFRAAPAPSVVTPLEPGRVASCGVTPQGPAPLPPDSYMDQERGYAPHARTTVEIEHAPTYDECHCGDVYAHPERVGR